MRYVVTTFAVLSLALPAIAQDSAFTFGPDDQVILFPDGGRFFNYFPDSNLVYEAQLAPNIRIKSTVNRVIGDVLTVETEGCEGAEERCFKSRFAYTGFATIMVRLRMFDEDSKPVRTPSYMPKGTMEFMWLKSHADPNEEDDIARYADSTVSLWAISVVPWGHHSNGQNGCLFETYSRVDGECVPSSPDVTPADSPVNKLNGSFSTNYIRIGLHRRWMTLGGDLTGITKHQTGVGLSVEMHPSGYLPGSISDDLQALYGAPRLKVAVDHARRDVALGKWRLGRVEGRLGFEYLHDVLPGVPDVTTSAEAFLLPRGWGGAGIYLRYYRGQDYYNLGFTETISQFQFGFAFNEAKFLRFPIN